MFEISLNTQTLIAEALAYSLNHIRRNQATLTSYPDHTRAGVWVGESDGGWTGGHWVGLLWLAFAETGDPAFAQAAQTWAQGLVPRQADTLTHDLGFLFELSHVLGYRLTEQPAYKTPAIQAARTLIRRFNPRGRYLQAWGPLDGDAEQRGLGIIDTMMNLDLLYWATRETGESEFAEIATAHARTALERHVRADGSTSHTIVFDPDTGAFLRQDTHQGLSDTSCWSRGQAWAVYGFAECYRETGETAFLEAARRLTDYARRRQTEDLIPYWDYDSPLIPNDVRDSSAAAILASALLLLAQLEPDAERAQDDRQYAVRLFEALWPRYSSLGTGEPSLLIHATSSKPHGRLDHGLIYGDYYFVETLLRLKRPTLGL